jgi:hypothetical protein
LVGNGTGALQTVSPGTSGNLLSSNGTNWVSVSAPATTTGLGFGGTTWHNVAGSRSLGVTYTNARSYPIFVSASNGIVFGPTYTLVYINGTQIARQSYDANGAYGVGTVWFIVPPGATYAITGGGVVQYWWELY